MSKVSLSDFFQVKPFLIAFSLTMLYVYCFASRPEVIIKYPTPENAHEFVFKDDSENCYKFHTEEVKCPTDTSKINALPVQRRVETFQNRQSEPEPMPYNLDSNDDARESNMV